MNKQDFPFFIQNPELIYLDSAATTHKPQKVLDTMHTFYSSQYATVHRGIYQHCQKASHLYHQARETVASFIHAKDVHEIIFTKNTTDSINLFAQAFGETLSPGDTILLTELEHHSNLVPWQILAQKKQLNLKFIPVKANASLDLQVLDSLLTPDVKLLSVAHIANATGTVHPLRQMIQKAHANHTLVFVDGAQAPSRMPVNMQELDVDFYAFSSHKMYGPTGIGILYGKYEHLLKLPPVSGGGDMIEEVTLEKTTYQKPPLRFEAGTPAIVEAIGLKAAIDYLNNIGMKNIQQHEEKLLKLTLHEFEKIEGCQVLGPIDNQCGIISFTMEGMHPLDIATLLDAKQISIRSGHLCAQPILHRFGLKQIARISFGIYNDVKDLEIFFEELYRIQKTLITV